MALNTIDGRIRIKRSTVSGETPTIGPTSDYTDGTWSATTMIYPGEFFFNLSDERLWIGNVTGVTEINITGSTSTTTPGGTTQDGLNTYTGGTSSAQTVNVSALTIDHLTVSGDTELAQTSATTFTVLNSGATSSEQQDYSGNIIKTGVYNSAIVAGSGNTISDNTNNILIAGVGISGITDDTAYFSNVDVIGGLIQSGGTDLYNIFATSSGSNSYTTGGTYNSINNTIYFDRNDALSAYSVDISAQPMDLSFAISDETTALTTGTNKLTIYAPYGFTITDVKATLSTSGSTSSQFDVNVNDVTIFSTPITIDANEFKSVDAATPPVISGTTVSADDKITVDIDTAGTNAAGAKIYIIGNRS